MAGVSVDARRERTVARLPPLWILVSQCDLDWCEIGAVTRIKKTERWRLPTKNFHQRQS